MTAPSTTQRLPWWVAGDTNAFFGLGFNTLVNVLVLTGPPEMGKTAIARMLGLALLTQGWEVHETTRPEQVEARFDRSRPQLFIADDAFGSTEYRPDSAERWANNLDRILRATDEHHWLVWTSRPAPLRAGLRRLHRERGGEHFPQPAAVQVDASALGVERDVERVMSRAGAQHARRLAMDEGATRRVGVGDERVAHQLVPERERLVDDSGAHAGIDVLEQRRHRDAQHARQEVDVDVGTQHGRRPQRRRRVAERVDARRHRLAHARRRHLRRLPRQREAARAVRQS